MLLGSQALTNDPYYNNVSLLLSARDGVIKDYSKNNLSITANGNAAISSSQAKWGNKSIYFDGNGDYLTVSTSSDFTFGTNDFTIDGWLYKSDNSTDYTVISQWGTGGWAIIFYTPNRTKIGFLWGNGAPIIVDTDAFPLNQFVHFAVSRVNGIIRLFINGVQKASSTSPYDFFLQGNVVIGALDTAGNFPLFGNIEDLRITKGIARSIVVPTQPFPNW